MHDEDGFQLSNEAQKRTLIFVPRPIVKAGIGVSRVKMNAKNGALDTPIPATGDPCAVFPKNRKKTALTTPTLSYMERGSHAGQSV
jgi:hypothetical protein